MKTVILMVEMIDSDAIHDDTVKYLTEVCEVGFFRKIKTPKQFIDKMQGLYQKVNRNGGSTRFRITNVIIK